MGATSQGLDRLVTALAFAAPLLASASDMAVSPQEKLEVVGSRIARLEGEGALPVTILERAQIERMGATRLSEVLLLLPYFSPGGLDRRIIAAEPLHGAAAVSLRGLGPSATLVLVNGRRIAPYGVSLEDGGAFAELDSLPLAAVERIEILRDGASAIYGADAIAGVVNVVLRRDFRGVEAAFTAAASGRGDARRRRATLAAGAGNLEMDGYNVFALAEFMNDTGLPSTARAFSRSADQRPNGGSDNRLRESVPPTVRIAGERFVPGPDCPAQRVRPLPDALGAECVFDVAPFAFLLPDVGRADLLVVGNYRWNPQVRVFAEAMMGRTRTTRGFSPVGASVELPAGLAANPFGRPVSVFFRPLAAGPRRLESTLESQRLVAGAVHAAPTWEWELAGGVSRVGTDSRLSSTLQRSRLNAAVNAGRFDPFADNNDSARIEPFKADVLDRYDGRLGFVQAKARGEAARWAAGPLAFVLGGETRQERFFTRLDPLTLSGDLSGSSIMAAQDGSGSRRIVAAFAEAGLPLSTDLEMQVAGRYDHYPLFGGEVSPKTALRWRPAKEWLVRFSIGRGFLPPSLFQSHLAPQSQEEEIRDAIRCPVTRLPGDCVRTVPYSIEGNRVLQPERSRQFSAGLAWEPSSMASAGLDVWQVDHRGKIAPAEDHLLANETAFPGRIVRGAPDSRDAELGLPGPILEIRDTFINLARQRARGIDFEANLRWPRATAGQFRLGAQASYQQSFRARLLNDSPEVELAGTDGRPRWRADATASWERGPRSAGLTWRYVGAYSFEDGVAGIVRRASPWTTLDAHAAWVISSSVRVAIVARNVMDRAPPFRPDRISGYDSRVHDAVGRYFLATLRLAY